MGWWNELPLHRQRKLNMITAVILGNGSSRNAFQLEGLKQFGTVYGCNAIHRDFYRIDDVVDYICCVDPLMVEEAKKAIDITNAQVEIISPEGDDRYEPKEMWKEMLDTEVPQTPKIGAGQYSIIHAIRNGHNHIKMIGFDFLCTEDDLALSNCYSGTHGYGQATSSSIEQTRFRMNHFLWMIKNNPQVNFEFIFPAQTTVYKFQEENADVTFASVE